MTASELPDRHEGARVFLVVYENGGLNPYAAAFSTRAAADVFLEEHHGYDIIETAVDRHLVGDESADA